MEINAEFPEKLEFLFKPSRYKVAYGGRGSAKSWSFARALLLIGLSEKKRILCAREIQRSIKDSVHKLLKDQIELLGLGKKYTALETEIRGTNGTEIAFCGLGNLTTETIKSYEGFDICWVEEAQTLTDRSWVILIPTIRKDGSEIWASYNPQLETDPTHQRMVINPPPDCTSVKINYTDNPWFNDVMDKERLHCKETDPKGYLNIWEGECRPAVEGAIYYDEILAASNDGRICNVPYDPLLNVHVIIDLGFGDAMSIGMVQKHASEIRLIDYIEDSQKKLEDYSIMLKDRNYNWGKLWLPHDGFSKGVKTGKSSAEIMEKFGWDVPSRQEIVEMSVEEGIKAVRTVFSRFYIDQTKCSRLIECCKRYRRHINRSTQAAGRPEHDEFSHGADMLRYLSVNIDKMTNGKAKVFKYSPPSCSQFAL